jgi:inner membrane protein
MRSLLNNKLLICSVLALAILIPLNLIQGLVQERQMRHAQVEAEISRSATGAQVVAGPILVLPCSETYARWSTGTNSNVRETLTRDCTTYTLPEQLKINGEALTDIRKRGIYEALVYTATLQLIGRINASVAPVAVHGGALNIGAPYLSLGITDPRGIAGGPGITVNGTTLGFEPSSRVKILGGGIHTVLRETADPGQPIEFVVDLRLNGMRQLDFLPLGRATEVALTSAWPHPSFVGNALPVHRKISDTGFVARWASSFLATNIEEQFLDGVRNGHDSSAILGQTFGVNFVPAVDVYLKSERATKYGILFVGITFIALLLTEVLKQLRIHPLQYLMVGVALAVFFLLVLALSEHVGFLMAYLIASAACVGLLSFYLAHCIRNRRLATGFGVVLSALYAALYGLLSSEDYALLMGSLLVFAMITATMVLTRRVDWYGLSGAQA